MSVEWKTRWSKFYRVFVAFFCSALFFFHPVSVNPYTRLLLHKIDCLSRWVNETHACLTINMRYRQVSHSHNIHSNQDIAAWCASFDHGEPDNYYAVREIEIYKIRVDVFCLVNVATLPNRQNVDFAAWFETEIISNFFPYNGSGSSGIPKPEISID